MPFQNIILAMTLMISSFSLHASANCNIASLDWLNGTWQSSNDNRIIKETWQTVSPLTIEGIGFTQKVNESNKSYESLRILDMSGELFFIAKVAHNEAPIPFKAITCDKEHVTFENKAHDFPNKLHYASDGNRLTVSVTDNKGEGFKLSFKKQ